MDFLNKLAKALHESLEKWLEEAEAKAKKLDSEDPPINEEEGPFTTFERIEKKIGTDPSPDPIGPETTQVELDDEAFQKELLELKKKLNEK